MSGPRCHKNTKKHTTSILENSIDLSAFYQCFGYYAVIAFDIKIKKICKYFLPYFRPDKKFIPYPRPVPTYTELLLFG